MTVSTAEPPNGRLKLDVEEVNVKDAAVTVRPSVTVLFKLPEVPVMVTVEVPATAVEPTVRVRTLLLVVLAGLNDAVTPAWASRAPPAPPRS